MKLITLASLILALFAFMAVGCSDDDEGPTGPTAQSLNTTVRSSSGDYWRTLIDATSYDDFVYYDFGVQDTLDLTAAHAENSTDWDLGFRRDVIVTNSGSSGPGSITVVDLTASGVTKDFADVTRADLASLSEDDWMADGFDLVVDNYYSYNPQTHALTPTNLVYAMKDAEGKYLKFQVAGFFGGGPPPMMANFIIKYVYATSGTDLSGTPVADTIDGSSGMFYYDFSAGQAITPADSANSLEWDIVVSNYSIFMNSSFSGPGQTGANPAYAFADMSDSTDISEYPEAITEGYYAQDKNGSAFLEWYNYSGPPDHLLTSKGHVYAVKAGGKMYKVYIETYTGDTGIRANVIFWWAEL
ncbi:MAG: HmuY family protein [bacterium]